MIRHVCSTDAQAIVDIYNWYIQESSITFEEQTIDAQHLQERILSITNELNLPWLVCEFEGRVVGYAYASQWKQRSAYRFSVEVSVYLDPEYQGRGLGRQLYAELFNLLQHSDIHSALAVITLPNEASVALHEKLGMKKVAHFEQVGYKFEQWQDVGYWQIIFD
ncbi:arsinothricin resistance N-acetyltransferase ArsN1 family B [Thalassotalea mangrovi]|uniref:N-acetyltransferase n=1 Tax=Thalassotalea mangrovi TaxID=2572245 RepID=A0A4U1B5G6_9GAMM|nr:arsinothricin resistance N-acetyltransferase ArsN1 family B [Thalassotalea mangrovi]TKB44869.1 N-acetyltransferase [Thalassotalea mangrovi]